MNRRRQKVYYIVVKLFLLGRPGTGKSTAARLAIKIAQKYGWDARHIDDYGILYWMYKTDRVNRFRPSSESLDGFDVIDGTVLDQALALMRERVDRSLTRSLNWTKLVVIEFARDTYRTSLEQFVPNFLQESYFLFLDTDLETCISRIEYRAQHPVYEGDLFISRTAMEAFYPHNDILDTVSMLKTEYHLDECHVKVIENINAEQDFRDKVREFIESIIELEKNKQA